MLPSLRPCLPLLMLALGTLTPAGFGRSAPGDPAGDDLDLTEMSLEDLMDMEVTIASRTAEKLSEVPAAVYVLTGDEIRRSGHSSIPEALRMVPGFHVSRWSTGAWDVTSRGFGPGLSLTSLAYLNQLLVMIDGVVVYTPLFAGVWWPIQDIDLDDVDRIEIVRGPGGILWGSNAVHGVVNIITKAPSETQGARVSLRDGTDDRHASARYGGTLGESGAWRAWAKASNYDTLAAPFLGFDYDWRILSAGLRADWTQGDRDWSVWTRAWESDFGQLGFDLTTFAPIQVTDHRKGVQLFGSSTDRETGARWQAWYATDRQDLPTLVDIGIDILDLEYTRESTLGVHQLNWGGGWHLVHSDLQGDDPFYLAFDPDESTQQTFRAHVLDRIEFPQTNSTLTLGVAAEHNDFTQFELQPTARLSVQPREDLMLWGAISRAVRTPSLEERFLTKDSFFIGSTQFRSESVVAIEVGARSQPTEWLSLDLALFRNNYDSLHVGFWNATNTQVILTNLGRGKTYGGELAVDVDVTDWWRMRGAYSKEKTGLETEGGQTLRTGDYSPDTTLNLRSYMNLGDDWELDLGAYLVDNLGGGFHIAEYFRLDGRLGWKPSDQFEFFIGIQNATEPRHSELGTADLVRRSVYGGVTWTP